MEQELSTVERLIGMSPALLLVITLNAAGFFLKRSPIANWMIPWILLTAGAVVYPFIGDLADVHQGVRNPVVYQAVVGALLGLAAVGVHQGITNWLRREKDEGGNTRFIGKD